MAEYSGRTWLAQGERHIDDLLANTLPDHVTIEVVSCESKSAVTALWRVEAGPDADDSAIWMIHPAIADRVRNSLRRGGHDLDIMFAEWSASLDDAAMDVLAAATMQLAGQPDAILAVVRHQVADGPAMLADLGSLRSGLIEAKLSALGVEASRMVRDTQPAGEGQSDHISLVIRLPD